MTPARGHERFPLSGNAGEGSREAELKREDDEHSTAWAFLWTLFAFKILSGAVILWAAGWSGDASGIIGATHWFWMALPVFAVAAPLTFQYRLRKVRRRRQELKRSEWMVASGDHLA